jgi:hypothetical protein
MTIENYKNLFLNYLETESKTLTQKSQQLKNDYRDDEYKFIQVELNIIDIFTKMFLISFQKAASAQNWQTILKETYLSFFDKIPMAWHENLKKCSEHGLEDEVLVETLKIQRADSIKKAFVTSISESV